MYDKSKQIQSENKRFLQISKNIFAFPLHRRTTIMGKVAGALLAVNCLKNARPLIHGPIGCAFQRKINPFYLFSNFNELPCVNMSEIDTIYGGEKKLKEAIKLTHDRYRPDLIVVITTCPSDITGDDVKAAIEDARAGCDVVYSNGNLMDYKKHVGVSVVGAQDVFYAIIDQLLEKIEQDKNSVNITNFPTHGSKFDMEEVTRILKKIGLKINGVYFDKATIHDIKKLPRAELNIVDYPAAWAIRMKEKFGIEYIETMPMDFRRSKDVGPYGIQGGKIFYKKVATHFGLENKLEKVIEEEKHKIEQDLEKIKSQLEGKRFGVSVFLFFHSGIIPIIFSDLNLNVESIFFSEVELFMLNKQIIHFFKGHIKRICKKQFRCTPQIISNVPIENEIDSLKSLDMIFVGRTDMQSMYYLKGIKTFNVGHFTEHYGRISFKTTLDFGNKVVEELNRPKKEHLLLNLLEYSRKKPNMIESWMKLEEMWMTLWASLR
ncbi:MAG: nitrogenase component 1 [Candidatus Helarchaeota archaeon]